MHIFTYLSNMAVTSAGWSLVIISIHADSMLDACCGSSMNESSKSSSDESMTKDDCCEEIATKDVCVAFCDGCDPADWAAGMVESIDGMNSDCWPFVPGGAAEEFTAALLLLEGFRRIIVTCELVT